MATIQLNIKVMKILIPILFLIWIPVLFKLVLFFRNISFVKGENEIPSILEGFYTQEEFEKGKQNNLTNSKYVLHYAFVPALFLTLYFVFQIYKWLWLLCGQIKNMLSVSVESFRVLSFIVLFGLFRTLVVTTVRYLLPVFLYGIVFESEPSYVKMKYMFSVVDYILAPIIGYSIFRLVRKNVSLFLISSWTVFAIFFILMINIQSIASNSKIEDLPDGELKEGIRNLTTRVGFPFHKVYYDLDSDETNAAFGGIFGFGSILIEGKFLSNYTDSRINETVFFEVDEILAVTAHELGHWNHKHQLIHTFVVLVKVGAIMGIVSLLLKTKGIKELVGFNNKTKVERQEKDDAAEEGQETDDEDEEGQEKEDKAEESQEKANESTPIEIALYILLVDVLAIIMSVLQFLEIPFIERPFEFQADAYAKSLGYSESLQIALIHTSKYFGFIVDTDSWYNFFNKDHPTTVERIHALQS